MRFPSAVLLIALLPSVAIAAPTLDAVIDCGATPNDSVDDTAPLQACLDRLQTEGGGTLHLPLGQFHISDQGRSTALQLPSNITVIGEGPATVLKLVRRSDGYASTRMMVTKEVPTRNVRISDLTFDGGRGDLSCADTKNDPTQSEKRSKGEQQHAIFFASVEGATVDHVFFQKLSGDAIYVYGKSKNVFILDEVVRGYCRAGVVVNSGGSVPPPTNIVIRDSRFFQDPSYQGTVHARAIDLESHADAMHVEGNTLDEFQAGHLKNSTIRRNTFYGEGLAMVYSANVRVEDNWFRSSNTSSAAPLSIRRSSTITATGNVILVGDSAVLGIEVQNDAAHPGRNFRIEDNVVVRQASSAKRGIGIHLYGIDDGATLRGNLVKGPWQHGLRVGGGRRVRIEGNDLEGVNALSLVGVRATFPLSLRGRISAQGNTLRGEQHAIVGECFPSTNPAQDSCDGDVKLLGNRRVGAKTDRAAAVMAPPDSTSAVRETAHAPSTQEKNKRPPKKKRRRRR